MVYRNVCPRALGQSRVFSLSADRQFGVARPVSWVAWEILTGVRAGPIAPRLCNLDVMLTDFA